MEQNKNIFNLSNFTYKLSPSLVAQEPVSPRDSSRLLIVKRKDKSIQEVVFKEIVNFLNAGDVLVLNDTKVIKAKLLGRKERPACGFVSAGSRQRRDGAKIDVLLVKEKEKGIWQVLASPAKRVRVNDLIIFEEGKLTAKVLERSSDGGRVLQFFPKDIDSLLETVGKPPLPHYIKKEIDDFQKYQTIYAKKEGAIAAPTAGLHFTPSLLSEIDKKGVKIVYVTLHCGLATFRPVKTEDIRSHSMESEWIDVSSSVEKTVNSAKKAAAKIIAVGTTSIRTSESVAFTAKDGNSYIKSFSGETNLYIMPGYKFKIINAALTNFHTPCSTNLILVSCFCGLDLIKQAYDYAIKQKFRFFSFGDAMLII